MLKFTKETVLRLLLICCFLLVLMGCQSDRLLSGKSVTVEKVISGQTIETLPKYGEPIRETVRLSGIDAPTFEQKPWGGAAKDKLIEIFKQNKSVWFEPEGAVEKKDKYDRFWGFLWQDETLINEELIAQGYVLANLEYCPKYCQRLRHAQEYARLMGYGIWNPQQPLRMTPKEFRSQKK